jgi:hypothetical protein
LVEDGEEDDSPEYGEKISRRKKRKPPPEQGICLGPAKEQTTVDLEHMEHLRHRRINRGK